MLIDLKQEKGLDFGLHLRYVDLVLKIRKPGKPAEGAR